MFSQHDQRRLDTLYAMMARSNTSALGYPGAKDFVYTDLAKFLEFPINNVGDPFATATYQVQTREFECEVVAFFAELFRAAQDQWWGYVTNGGTEGNLYGLYLAREAYPNGIVYYSEHTHYSVSKSLHFLGMRHIMVRAQENGEIDYAELLETLKDHRDAPPIIFANVGTTMTEARDDIGTISEILHRLAIKEFYIHSDAALSGGYAPFLKPRPRFDFADGADSISISGHKFIGSPIPCGVVLAKTGHVHRVARSIDYIGSSDTTITGSRNGFTPLILWKRIRTLGREGLEARTNKALALAAYAEKRLNDAGIAAWRNPDALTVVLPRVSERIQDRWQVATQGHISHIIVLPNVSKQQVDAFVADCIEERSVSSGV